MKVKRQMRTSKTNSPGTQGEQSRRFIETARALGADEDVEHFRDKLRVIARQKPKDEPKPKKDA